MNPHSKTPILIFFAFILAGCSVQGPFYNKKETEWETRTVPSSPVRYTVYLVGSIGDAEDSTEQVLGLLQDLTRDADTSHATIFLSDHIYSKGIPEDEQARKKAEEKLDDKISFLKKDKGKILFIAGTHDLPEKKKKKLPVLQRSHEAVEKLLGRKNLFFPEGDCPGPATVALTEDWIVVPVNTLWWLQENKEKNTDCENKNAEDWIDEVKDVIDNNQRKTILVLGHHPLLNVGNHGGYFSLKQHIFPFTDLAPWMYLPLPIVGSIYPMYRAGIGTPQDLAYPPYKKMRSNLFEAFRGYDNVMYASGHEHSLQYIKYYKQDFIITNASVRTDWAGRKQRANFSYSHNGLVRLSLLQNGEVWMDVLTPGTEPGGTVVFRKRLKDNSYAKPDDSTALKPFVPLKDSTLMLPANESLEAGKFVQFFLGKHYRDAWTTPVEVPVLDLNQAEGGLTIIKKGGGFQTQSLQVKNKKGEEFSLRSVTKYTERILGPMMQNTLAADIVEDQTSTTHPYAAYVVDDLSSAAGIYHSEPKLVYIPNDPKLAEYRKDFANTLALFEQRADGRLFPSANFGYVTETVNSAQMLKSLHKDHDNGYDEALFLKSRLFDMWINDWDRHQNNWRWGVVECTDSTRKRCEERGATKQYYVPLPKDRDQAFARFDGVFPWFAGRKWVLRKFQHFDTDVRDVPGLNFNARHIDHALLTELPEESWLQMAEELSRELSDEKIEQAVRQLPEPVYQKDGADMIATLKARRSVLSSIARRYYEYLAREVNVIGSDKQEIFEVNRLNDDSTSVRMFAASDNRKGRLLYHRIFKTAETKEVRLYGFGGDDIILVNGDVRKGILVRIVGGGGHDSIVDGSSVRGLSHKTVVYDTKDKNSIQLGEEAKDRTSDSKSINEYDFYANNYNLLGPATFFGYNVDDGLFVGGGIIMRYHGFRKKPYANFQRMVANTAVKEFIFNFKYTGDFNNVMGNWGVFVDLTVLAPKSTTNFFGLGNETRPASDAPPLYYRIRYDEVRVFPAFKRHLGKYQFIKVGPLYDYVRIEKTENRFISSAEGSKYITDFTGRNYLGARLEYELSKFDDSVMTRRGLRWMMAVSALREFKGTLTPVNLQSEVNAFIPIPNRSTLALRFGGAHLLGNYDFYMGNTLGGQSNERGSGNLRGYHRGRFAGRSSLYFNGDIRIKLLSFRTYLFPARFGVLGFYDAARVWTDGESSRTWHTGYGWGVWLMPFGKAILNLTYGISKEQSLVTLNMGFLF